MTFIGSEVGTGKTVLAIGAAKYLKDRGDFRGMVVVVPKMAGVLPRQWESEIKKFAPDLNVVHGKGRDKHDRIQAYSEPWDVLILNYESARNDAVQLTQLFQRIEPSILYCDEASMFRNGSSKTARFVRRINPHFEYKFAVTGTPMQTNLEDLHGICSSMGWTELVGTKAWFQRQYCIRQEVNYYVKGIERKKWVTVGYKNLGELQAVLMPWFIRQLKRLSVGQSIREVGPEALEQDLELAGFSVTRPWKSEILPHLASVEPSVSSRLLNCSGISKGSLIVAISASTSASVTSIPRASAAWRTRPRGWRSCSSFPRSPSPGSPSRSARSSS